MKKHDNKDSSDLKLYLSSLAVIIVIIGIIYNLTIREAFVYYFTAIISFTLWSIALLLSAVAGIVIYAIFNFTVLEHINNQKLKTFLNIVSFLFTMIFIMITKDIIVEFVDELIVLILNKIQ